MDIQKYFEKINSESQQIFAYTIATYAEDLGKAHHLSTCIFEFSEYLFDKKEIELLNTVSTQIESSTLNLTLGLYRQAFSSLRLAFEMALGAVYFSINKLEHFEWLKGTTDIKWAKLIDKDNGVLSTRFSNAFFPELSPFIADYNSKASNVYRLLSEYVHGNNETWSKSGIQIKLNDDLINHFFSKLVEITEIILFALSCRYLKSIPQRERDGLEFLSSQLNHVEPIRVLLGGPKE
ncbi:MAG: hypothetical protein BGO70_12175 [Bacteroidetes bacterium 43-93]|nr:hypothetical protein [Bacteroidota bacterium]OJW98212.1 MAG: hypothetical protein BGO70_12175 [Bacteroidetes bacterium 43-93]